MEPTIRSAAVEQQSGPILRGVVLGFCCGRDQHFRQLGFLLERPLALVSEIYQ